MTKQERVAQANAVIQAISDHGRRFFYSGPGSCPARVEACPEGRVARFEIDTLGRIWFRDDYTWKAIYVAYSGEWKGWSHGGTLRVLVQALRDFIRTGKPINYNFFCTRPAWMAGGEEGTNIWGYSREAYQAVQVAVLATGAVSKPRTEEEIDADAAEIDEVEHFALQAGR
jgi:hypothetical protein